MSVVADGRHLWLTEIWVRTLLCGASEGGGRAKTEQMNIYFMSSIYSGNFDVGSMFLFSLGVGLGLSLIHI